jgi:Replication initiator protein A
MATVIKLRSHKPSPDPGDGRDECNWAEFPIALLTDRVPDGQGSLKYGDTIFDSGLGKTITRRLTITGSTEYGVPTAKDEEVLLGLILLTKLANNFSQRTVHFSLYELIHLLGWPDCGKSYHRIEESLNRLMGVTYYYDKAWWDKAAGAWVDEKFHILENVSLYDREHPRQASLPLSSFTWNKVPFRSYQAGYLKRLDFAFFLGLKTSTAKRLYRFLDKHFYHRQSLDFDLKDLAFEHIGLSRTYDTGKIKEKLAPAIEELEAKGFLEPLHRTKRYAQVRRGEWKVNFIKKAKDIPPLPAPPPIAPLQKELIDRGVTARTAADLVAAVPPECIAAKLEVFDWLTENNDPRLSQNPAGYLVASIREDYAAPKDFQPKAEREKKKQAAEEKRRQKEEERVTRRRQEEREAATRKAKRAHIDAYLKALTPQERKGLEEQALANADEKMREAARPGSIAAEMALRILVDDEVLRISPLPEMPPSS